MSPLNFAAPSVSRAHCSTLWDVLSQAEQHRPDRKADLSSRLEDE